MFRERLWSVDCYFDCLPAVYTIRMFSSSFSLSNGAMLMIKDSGESRRCKEKDKKNGIFIKFVTKDDSCQSYR